MRFKDIAGVEAFLETFVENAHKYIADNLTLERMWDMLERAGSPHEKLKVIHIAGTSGKTSTCYYIASLLHASGKKVGLSVSPHIFSVTERVQINTKTLPDKPFCRYLEKFIELLGDEAKEQSYFEFMIVFALWVFVQEKVDYVVLETGLGGRLDSTNVVTRSDKVCVITDIGYDHQHILGNSLEEIAYQKAGIIHKGNTALSYEQSSEIMKVINNETVVKKATLQSVEEKNDVKYDDLAWYQNRNFTLALRTAEFVANRDNFELKILDPRGILVPGRMQWSEVEGKKVLLDGAHNPQKMRALVRSLKVLYPNKKFHIILAMKKSKDYKSTIAEIKPVAEMILCTELGHMDGSEKKGVDVKDLAHACDELNVPHKIVRSPLHAIEIASTTPLIITGSLYLFKEFRDNVVEKT